MSTTRVYQPLNAAEREIRLIVLRPSRFKSRRLECDLTIVSLNKCPPFAAVSYVWGDATDTTTIRVHGIDRQITKNLATFLQEFRRRRGLWHHEDIEQESLQYVWADALSINQTDVNERNHQVGTMRDIYAAATVVISWLDQKLTSKWSIPKPGQIRNPIAHSFRVLQTLGERLNLKHPTKWTEIVPILRSVDTQCNGALLQGTSLPQALKHQYFDRVWVMQEMSAAQKHVFWSAEGTSLDGQLLYDVVDVTLTNAARSNDLHPVELSDSEDRETWKEIMFLHFASLWNWRDLMYLMRRPGEQRPFAEIFREAVIEGRYLESSDPRDKVYAFCSISGGIDVDYSMTTKDVFCAFQQQFAKHDHQPLSFLVQSGQGEGDYNPHGLPSWCPDLANDNSRVLNVLPKWYNANESIEATSDFRSDDTLLVSGVECDRITETGAVPSYKSEQQMKWFNDYVWRGNVVEQIHPAKLHRALVVLRSMSLDLDWYNGRRFDFSQQAYRDAFMKLADDYLQRILAIEPIELSDVEKTKVMLEKLHGLVPGYYETDDQILQALNRSNEEAKTWVEESLTIYSNPEYVGSIPNTCSYMHTESGYFGMAPKDTRPGDIVCVVGGCPMPIILRPDVDYYTHIGGCFVLGLMDGEAAEHIQSGKFTMRQFQIR